VISQHQYSQNAVIASFTPWTTTFPQMTFSSNSVVPLVFLFAVWDRSVQSLQKTFGWVLAIRNPRRTLLRQSVPAFGSCIDFLSYQSVGSTFQRHWTGQGPMFREPQQFSPTVSCEFEFIFQRCSNLLVKI
jgi:hypothetical protein